MVASAPIHTFLVFIQLSIRTMFFQSHWLSSHITIVESTTGSSERGMNPVAMTIINPWKEYWPSQGLNLRLPVQCSLVSNTTDLAMGLGRKYFGLRKCQLSALHLSMQCFQRHFHSIIEVAKTQD